MAKVMREGREWEVVEVSKYQVGKRERQIIKWLNVITSKEKDVESRREVVGELVELFAKTELNK